MTKVCALLLLAALSSFAQSNLRGIPFLFGSNDQGTAQPLVAGAIEYLSVPFTCPTKGIVSWDLSVDQGSIGIDVWRVHDSSNSNRNNPTAANKITGSAMPAITNGQHLTSSSLPGWDTSVQQHDQFAAYVSWVQGGTTQATLVLACY